MLIFFPHVQQIIYNYHTWRTKIFDIRIWIHFFKNKSIHRNDCQYIIPMYWTFLNYERNLLQSRTLYIKISIKIIKDQTEYVIYRILLHEIKLSTWISATAWLRIFYLIKIILFINWQNLHSKVQRHYTTSA